MSCRRILYILLNSVTICICIFTSYANGADLTVINLNNTPDIAVYELTGGYDALLPDGSSNTIPRQEVAKEFYKAHPDEYDFLVFFSNFDFQMPQNEANAFYQGVKNDVQGIGLELADNSSLYGSNGVLQGTIDMGNITSMVTDPLDPGFSDTMATLSHELLHRWAAKVTFRRDDNSISTDLLGMGKYHWSFLLDTAGSLEYGNQWVDNGNGTFTSLAGRRYFSPLDMYLMGFIGKSEVFPMLLINNPEIAPERLPEPGVTIAGTPQFVTIDKIIAAEGERIPSVADSQKTFRIGCIFLTRPGTYSESALPGIRNIMQSWSMWFSGLTNGHGKITIDNAPLAGLPENPGPDIPPIDPRTAPPEINDGVAWLLNNQKQDGSWQDSLFTADRDTSTVLFTLADYSTAAEASAKGVSWLENSSTVNLDYLARKIELLGNSGIDVSGLIAELIDKQNPDGGWGSNRDYGTSPTDTALAFRAITAWGGDASSVIGPAISYLRGAQNDDSGWGADGRSTLQTTIDVITSFVPFTDQYQLGIPVQNALNWVHSKQNGDGGFGNSPSSIYITAQALIALKKLGITSAATDQALTYLLERQAQDGSWYASAFQTALAVKAIWISMHDPDLSVSTEDIVPSPDIITLLPTDIRLSVTVHNSGMAEVTDAKVVLYEGEVSDSSRIGEASLTVSGRASETLVFNTSIIEGKPQHYFVVVDPDNQIKESSELNNSALRIVNPESTYDFAALQEGLSIAPAVGNIFEPLAITAKIRNNGTVDAFSVPVHLVADKGTGPLTVATQAIDLPAGQSIDHILSWVPEISGAALSLSVVVDPHNAFAEMAENNNSATVTIDINGSSKPDLALSYSDISFDPAPALEGADTSLRATVRNRGFSPATDVRVDFFDSPSGESGNALLGSVAVPVIAPGESLVAALDWTKIPVSGKRVISVVLDPQDAIDEISEDNNSAFTTLQVLTLPDFAVSDTAISFSPEAPHEGDPVTVTAVVQNQGEQSAVNIPVAFREGSALLGTSIIPEIAANGQATASITFPTEGKVGITEIEVIVDPESTLPEQDKTNNRAVRSVGVQNADLWLSNNYISPNGDGIKDSTQFGCRLAAPQNVTVAVVDEKAVTAREYSGADFSGTSFVSLTWDGLDTKGRLVADGQYHIQVLAETGSVLASLLVTVDTNRSSLLEAIGTPYLYQRAINDFLVDNRWIWLPDESGILFYIETPNENIPAYPTGLYTMTPTGGDINRIVPWEWNTEFDEATGYRFKTNSSDCNDGIWSEFFPGDQVNPGFSLAGDGVTIAFILERYNKGTGEVVASQLWTVNRFGTDLTLLASYEHSQGEQSVITDIFWSPDGSHLAFKRYDQIAGQHLITVIRSDGSENMSITPAWTTDQGYEYALYWSPDSKQIAFAETGRVVVADLSGSTDQVMPVGEHGTFINWLSNSRILIRDLGSSPWQQSVWIADSNPGVEPQLIGEDLTIPLGIYNSQQCIRAGSQEFNAPVMESGHFLAAVDWSNYPYYEYMICNAEGACQDAPIFYFWWNNFSLSPDSKYMVHSFYDGLLEVYNMDTRETDVSVIGSWACDIDWEGDYPDMPSTINILPLEGECDLKAFMEVVRWNWLDETNFLAYYFGTPEGVVAFDFATRKKKYLPESWQADQLLLSPAKRYISYTTNYDKTLKDYHTVNVNGSLLNLTAEIQPGKSESAVNLKGTAADLNFAHWQLEYADQKTPDNWHIITPPSENQVVNGLLSTWVPPDEGTFLVRLTVADKAGNSTWDRRPVTWGKKFSVTDIYKTGELFSPNGDGVKDTVGLNYFVHEPVHLELFVYDQEGSLIRTFNQDHAVPGEYGIVWDGRDESGGIVADGYYAIRIFDYEFFFQVDTTPPEAQLKFSPVACETESGLRSILSGLALDANLQSWVVSYGYGDVPQDWYAFRSGETALGWTGNNGEIDLVPDEIQDFTSATSPSISFLGDTTFRIVAEDFAGNQSVVAAQFNEELLVLSRWDGILIDLENSAQGGCESPATLSSSLLAPGPHTLSIDETLRNTISSATVQYRMNMQWHDAEELTGPPNGEIALVFDTSSLVPEDIAAVRIKIVDAGGIEYYSNSVIFNPPVFSALMGCIPIGCLSPALISMSVSLPESLLTLKFQATRRVDGAVSWEDFAEFNVFDGFPYQFAAPSPDALPAGLEYPLRFVGIGEGGRVYTSNEVSAPLQCGEGGGGGVNPPCHTTLAVSYSGAIAPCNSVNDGPATMAVQYCPLDEPKVLPDKVNYYLEENGVFRLLKQFVPARDGWGSVAISTNGLAEGEHQVRVDLVYGESVVEGFRQGTLLVDRTLPEAKITYPSLSAPFCAREIVNAEGETLYYTDIEGIAKDAHEIRGYAIAYGQGSNPSAWFNIDKGVPCRPEEGDCTYRDTKSTTGQLGVWNVTGLEPVEHSLQLMVTDAFGNTTCSITQAKVARDIPSLTASVDTPIFSPNADGVKDAVSVAYQVGEYAVLDITVLQGNALVRTLVSAQEITNSSGTVSWDGLDGAGTTVADGNFQIHVEIRNSCGISRQESLPVTVDTTPPTAMILYPGTGEPPEVIIEVTGTVNDLHLLGYQLHAEDEASTAGPILLGEGDIFAENNILGIWNTFGLAGDWSLILRAEDRAGNTRTTSIPVAFGTRTQLISKLKAAPNIFSPNKDGQFDTTTVTYELTDTANITLGIEDILGNPIASESSPNTLAGSHQFLWDGLDGEGKTLADGRYKMKVTAESVMPPFVVQVEAVTLIIDTTSPAIEVTAPLDSSYHSGIVTVQGALRDLNLQEYRVTLAGGQEQFLLNTAVVSSQIVFSESLDLADKVYQLQVDARDSVDNASSRSISFTVDATRPRIALESPAEGDFLGGPQAAVSIKGIIEEPNLQTYRVQYGAGTDPAEWVDLAVDEELPPDSMLATWSVGPDQAVADGDYTIRVTAADKAGGESEARVGIHVDNNPPALAVAFPDNGGFINEPFDINGTVNDPFLQEYILEIAGAACSSAANWSVLRTGTQTIENGTISSLRPLPADGAYCIRLSAFDFLGNTSEAQVSFTIDTTPPSAPSLSGSLAPGSGVSLAWQGNTEPDLAGFNLYRNTKKINTRLISETAYLDQDLTEGEYTYTVRAVDLAGLESGDSNEVVFTLDLTPPAAIIDVPRDGSVVRDYMDIKGRAYSADDFREYRVFCGFGENPESWQMLRRSPVPVSYGVLVRWDAAYLADGLYTIRLEAEDLNGNINVTTVSVTVDNTPPAAPVLLTAAADGSIVDLAWKANVEPDLAGYLVYRGGQLANEDGPLVGDLVPYLLTGLAFEDADVPDGTHAYYLVAMDLAGNMSDQSNIIQVSINTRPPHLNITTPASGLKFDRAIPAKAESEDTDIATVQFQFQRSGENDWTDFGALLTQSPYVVHLDPWALGWDYGSYLLRAVAADLGGLTDEAPQEVEIQFTDVTPPAAPTGSTARVNGGFVTLSWNQSQEADLAGYNVYLEPNTQKRNTALLTDTAYIDPAGSINGLPDGAYRFSITAVDAAGNESSKALVTATVFTPILNQPRAVVNQADITVDGHTVPEATVEIFRNLTANTESLGTTQADATSLFALPVSLTEMDNILYAVATDPEGNISRPSATRLVVYDLPPATPTGLAAEVSNYDVRLSWDANAETDLLGYNLYRNGKKINRIDQVVSGSYSASAYSTKAYLAADGNPDTYWNSSWYSGAFGPAWWNMEFGSQVFITSIEIEWGGTEPDWLKAGKDYVIQALSGGVWNDIAQVSGNSAKINGHQFDQPVKAEGIRIYITATTDSSTYKTVQISEVRILHETCIDQTTYDDLALPDGEYTYQVSAIDIFGSESPLSEKVSVVVGDVLPPAAPLNLVASSAGSDCNLAWNANTEPDLAGYNIYRKASTDWQKINLSPVAASSYTDAGLKNDTYTYRVTAVDQVGNESGPSNESSAVITQQLPAPPANLAAASAPEGRAIDLCWNSSVDPVAGYLVYRSLVAGGPYVLASSSLIQDSCYRDPELRDGTEYFYVVRARDGSGNESENSNEASAIPQDGIAPDKPLLLLPTVSGRTYQSPRERVDVAGFTEAGALVDLIHNQEWIDTLYAQKDPAQEASFLTNYPNIWETVVTPDGKSVYYSMSKNSTSPYSYYIYRKDLETGVETRIDQIPEGSWNPMLSPDGTKLAYCYEDAAGRSRIGIFDLTAGTVAPLTTTAAVDEYDPAWSKDGTKIVFDSDRGDGVYDVWLHDVPSGETSRVTQNFEGFYPEISPDNQKIAFAAWDSIAHQLNLYLVDVQGGTPVLLEEDADWTGYYPSVEWSPQANKLAFTANRDGRYDISVFDADTGESSRLTETEQTEIYLQWSPDGKHLSYYAQSGAETEVRMISTDGQAEDLLLHSFAGSVASDFNWLPAGIFYRVGSDLHRIIPPGAFIFNDVGLHPGQNIFTATAEDNAGNVSQPADAIVVQIDAEAMPDLEVLDQDIYVLPDAPLAGEQATVGAVVRNRSAVPAENVQAEIYLWDAKDNFELIHTETLSHLAPYAEEWLSVTWDSTGMVGTNSVFVVLDPQQEIAESHEDNNFAATSFYVAEEAGVTFETTLNGSEFGSDEVVAIDIDLHNSGQEKNVRLTVTIEDENGVLVDALAVLDKTLSYGGNERVELSWNAGSVFAGTYQVRTVLVDTAAGLIGEQIKPFTVLPDIDVNAVLTTNEAEYDPDETVSLALTVSNQGSNVIIPELNIKLTVADANLVHHVEEHTLANLFPMDSASLIANWNTARNAPGRYTAAVEIFINNERVAASSTEFVIVPVMGISGSLSVEPKVIFRNGGVKVGYSVAGSGNVEAGALLLKFLVLDTSNWTAVTSHEESITLGLNETVSGQHEFPSLPWNIGGYQVLLQSIRQGEIKSLASDFFTVKDGVAPLVSVQSPVDGSILSESFDLAVTATDDATGVAKVEYQRDNGSWRPLPLVNPATGRYAAGWQPAEEDEGPHTVRFRATDNAGNESLPVASAIVIRPRVEMTTATDKASYGMNEDVAVSINLTNIAWQKHVRLVLQIENQGGAIVAQVADEDLVLAADGQQSLNYSWQTGSADAGTYNIRSKVLKNGTVLQENLVPFVIEKVLLLVGTVTVSGTSVPVGDPVTVAWSVANNSNFTLTGLTVENILTDQALTQLQTWTETIALNKGQAVSGSFQVQTQGMALGSYQVALKARYESGNVDLAATQFTLIDITPPLVTIISPAAGTVVDGPIEVAAAATDDAAGVDGAEYRIDQGAWQPLPVRDPGGNTYAALWTPLESDEGNRTISFRALDKSGNTSEPVGVAVTVELCKAFAELAGSLNFSPEPLYFSQDVVLAYTLTNQCNKPLDDLNIKVTVLDPATGETVHEDRATANIAPGATSAGSFVLSSADLEVQRYNVVLEGYQADNELRMLAVSSFEVLAAVEGENKPLAQTNLLVWFNNGQESCQVEGCASSARLETILGQTTDNFRIICSRDDFEQELRNPFHTDIMIIGDQHQLTDHHDEELREIVHSGTGLISFGWNVPGNDPQDGNGHNDHKESFLGVTAKGVLPKSDYSITLADSAISMAGQLAIYGQLAQVESADDTEVAGWLTDDCRGEDENGRGPNRNAESCEYPMIVLHEYGLGKTVYTAFDLCDAFTDVTDEQLTALLTNAVRFVHRPDDRPELIPYQIRPFTLEITSRVLASDLLVRTTCPPEITLFDPASDDWVKEYPWEVTLPVHPGEPALLPYYVLAPDLEGVFACEFNTGFVEGGQYTSLWKFIHEFAVPADRVSRLEEAMSLIGDLAVSGYERAMRDNALRYLQNVLARTVTDCEQTELNIHDLEKAVNSLIEIESVAISEIRLQLDTLLRIEQGRCYFYE